MSAATAMLLCGSFLAGSTAPATPDRPAVDLLRRLPGVWDATLQMASLDDSPPLIMNGMETVTGDGTWLVSDFRSQLDGRPFQGHGILARDPQSGRYRRVWADSTSPAFWSSEGTCDETTGTLTMWIEAADSEGRPVRWREVTTWKDDDTRTFTMYVPGPETTEAAGMTIAYRRRKQPGGDRPVGGTTASPAAASPAPDAEHALVARGAGAWKATVDNRMDPGRPAESSQATEINVLCCGGLFLLTDFAGEERGRPFRGHGVLGYNPQKKKFISAWIDSGDRRLSLSEGDYDAAREALTFRLHLPDGKGGTVALREVLEWKGADQRVMTMYAPGPDGRETPGLTIKYRRLKGP